MSEQVKINRRDELRGRLDSGLDFEDPFSLRQIACDKCSVCFKILIRFNK
jgi:hypothetical protein